MTTETWPLSGEVRDCGIYGLLKQRIRTQLEELPLFFFFGGIMWHNTRSPNNAENIADVTHPNICVMKCLSASSLSHNDVQEEGKKKQLLNDWFWETEKCNARNEKVGALKIEDKGKRVRKCDEKKKRI